MATAETLRRRAARHDERERSTVTVSEPAMASIRLRGAFDAAQRGPLSGGRLAGLAERITAGTTTEADRDLLEAFDPDDLALTRALPGAFLRAHATDAHWRAMVSYRDE